MLARITRVLLDESSSPEDLATSATALYDCLNTPVRSVLVPQGPPDDRWLPEGLALAPTAAAECTKDAVRTAMFLRGLRSAIGDAILRFPGQTIQLVYAGTGPLAPLVLPLLVLNESLPVEVTLLDAHAESVDAVRTLTEYFGVTGFIRELLHTDATLFELPQGRRLHVLVAETMQRSLGREPQVAMVRHFGKRLPHGAIVVPESVRVDLEVTRVSDTHSAASGTIPGAHFVQTLLDLRAESSGLPLDSDGCLPPVLVQLPRSVSHPDARATLETFITTYGPHRIAPGSSGLTMPEILWNLRCESNRTYEFRYRTGSNPGFVWRAV